MHKILLATIASLAIATTSVAGDRPIAPSALPADIQAFVALHFPTASILRAEVDNDSYDVDLNTGYELEFRLTGEWDSIDGDRRALPDSTIPADILSHVRTNYPGATIVEIDRGHHGYEVELSTLRNDLFFPYNGPINSTTPALGNVRLLNSTVKPGDQIIITGINFTAPAIVKVNGVAAGIVSVNAREIIATMPDGVAITGASTLSIETNGATLNAPAQSWTYSTMPVISAHPVSNQPAVKSWVRRVNLVTTATGSSDLTYEWQYRNPQGQWLAVSGPDFVDANTGTLSMAASEARVLRCAVSTRLGTVYSNTVNVTPMENFIPTPTGIVIDKAATNYKIYVADETLHAIQTISTSGSVATLAGKVTISGSLNGTGTNALFDEPRGMTIENDGTLLVADSDNDLIRAISPTGEVITVGTGIDAHFDDLGGLAAVDTAGGDTYIADTENHLIKKLTATGAVSIVAGRATSGTTNGALLSAQFNSPANVAVDVTGKYIYVADTANHVIRIMDLNTSTVSTFAGQMRTSGARDGTALTDATFNSPGDLLVDDSGDVYVADTGNSRIRVITSGSNNTRMVVTLAGSERGFRDGTGTNAWFSRPAAIALKNGTLYVADTGNGVIRTIAPNAAATVTTIALNSSSPAALREVQPQPQPQPITPPPSGNGSAADSSSGGGGGGGAPSLWFFASLALLGGLHLYRQGSKQ